MPKLWYKTPAREYMAGLPVGNGRLAAMVLGDPCCERLALNHEWLWRGCNRQRECDASADRLAAVRELLLAGDLARAPARATGPSAAAVGAIRRSVRRGWTRTSRPAI